MHGMLNRRTLVASALALPMSTWAATWPTRPLRIVLPFAAGGSSDLVARLLAEKLSQALGSPVVVESRAGANGIIASEAVGRSTDGHSLLWVSAAHAINASLYPRLPYDSQRDFAPVALVASPGPMVIAVPAALPVRSLPDLMDLARRKPGQVSYASAGVGNVLHLAGEMLAQQAGVQLLHVPYKGAAPALNDLAAGQVNLMFNSALSVAPMVKDGRIRLLAQTGAQRSPALPADLPTVTETPGLAWSAGAFCHACRCDPSAQRRMCAHPGPARAARKAGLAGQRRYTHPECARIWRLSGSRDRPLCPRHPDCGAAS